MTSVKDALMKLEDVAVRLGVSRTTVRNYIKRGRLKAVKMGWSIRIWESELRRFVGKGAEGDEEKS